jgi:CheY-like chemotaxis protein
MHEMQEAPVIIVAEDDPDIGFLVCHELRRGKTWTVSHFLEGRSALTRMQKEPRPVALVTDLDMPVMNGFDLIGELRRDARFDEMPIVVFSSSVDPADERRCGELRVNEFVRKGLPLPELRARLQGIIGTTFAREATC